MKDSEPQHPQEPWSYDLELVQIELIPPIETNIDDKRTGVLVADISTCSQSSVTNPSPQPVNSSCSEDSYSDTPPKDDGAIPNNIRLADGTKIPIKPIRQFNSCVYQLEQSSLHHPSLPWQFIFKVPNLERTPTPHHELQIYEHLKSLQGDYIPRCYGEASWVDDNGITHNQGIILENLDGETLFNLRTRTSAEQKKKIVDSACQAVQKIASFDVAHSDLKLDNLIYTDQRVKVIDFDVSDISEMEYAHDANLNDLNIYFQEAGYHTDREWEYADTWKRKNVG